MTAGDRPLPAPAPTFRVGTQETLGGALRRVTANQFDDAIGGLLHDEPARAIHEARKSLKRLRAVLRLIRPELGEDRYATENRRLRDTARLLAPARDTEVAVLALRDLRDRHLSQLAPTALGSIERSLVERRESTLADLIGSGTYETALRNLRSASARFRAWPAEDGIRHRFSSLGPGLERTYGRGRREMRTAFSEPTAYHHHQWRKRVKYLRHQLEFLTPVWPEIMTATTEALDQLGECLGGEHDLAELLRLIADEPWLCPDPVERSLLTALAQHRRSDLRRAAHSLGRRVYAESPKRFVDRVGAWWSAWDEPVRAVGLDY